MRWPWTAQPNRENPPDDKASGLPALLPTPIANQDEPTASQSFAELYKQPAVLVASVAATACTLAGLRIYKSYLRRIPSVEYIKPEAFRKRSIYGTVSSVGDGDNFRLFHTPGGRLAGWGWLPWRRVPSTREGLSGQTIHIRIAGVDAPELAHFGRPAQPYGREALDFLTEFIHHRRVRAYIYRRDQYERVVATVYIRKWGIRRDIGLEMLKRGLATVYEAKFGAEYGKFEAKYKDAQEVAKRKKIGMWEKPTLLGRILGTAQKDGLDESPREYKTRMKELEKEKEKGKTKSSG